MAHASGSQDVGVSHAAGRPVFKRLQVVRRRYHFHGPLFIYVLTTVVLVFGAINGQNNLLFWLFGLAVGGLIVSGFLSGAALMGIEIEREIPDRAKAGEPLLVRYRVRNRNRVFPTCALVIEEIDESSPAEPAPDSWMRTIARCSTFVARVDPGKARIASSAAVPTRRGDYEFRSLRVWTTFPFGLTRKSVVFAGSQRVLVRPATPVVRLPAAFASTPRVEHMLSARRDREGDFFALREYLPGDPVRSIAWRASARAARPVIRENAPPVARNAFILLDVSPDQESTERVIAAAAGLIVEAARSGIRFAVSCLDGTEVVPMGSGPRHAFNAMDQLAAFGPGTRTPSPDPVAHRSRIVVAGHAGPHPALPGDVVVDASGILLPQPAQAVRAGEGFSPSRALSAVLDALSPRIGT